MAARIASDENKYKYMHGGRYGDRDLYLIREEKYGIDPNYEERRYRPGYRDNSIDYDAAQGGDRNLPGIREHRETRAIVNPAVPLRGEYVNPPINTRDTLTAYGSHGSPQGGIRGIDYEDSLAREPRHHHHHHHHKKGLNTRTYDQPDRQTRSYGSPSLAMRRSKSGKKKWTPLCDLGETEKYWVVRCEIPGVKKDKLSVEIEGKDLIIRGKRVKELWNAERLSGSGGSSISSSSSSTTTTVVKTTEAGVVDSKEQKSETEGGVTSGTTVTERQNPDGTVSSSKVSWVDKERGGRGTFKRKIRLPARVEQSAVQALYKEGILEVLVKKPENMLEKKRSNRVAIN